jgi:hypothetical protein
VWPWGSRAGRQRFTALAVVGLVLALGAASGGAWSRNRAHLALRAQGYRDGHAALAAWLGRKASAGATLALMDIGIVGFECPEQRILDITGLTDRTIAKSPGPFLEKEFEPAYVFDQRPEYLILTFAAPPASDGSVDADALRPWTAIEQRLLGDPAFARHYHRRGVLREGFDELMTLAAQLGARRVFRHAHPNLSYLLVVYERQPESPAIPPGANATPSAYGSG